MTVLQLVGVRSCCQRQDLIAKTYSEYRYPAIHCTTYIGNCLPTDLGIPRTIRNNNAVGFFLQKVIIKRNTNHRHISVEKVPDDAVLASTINNNDSCSPAFIFDPLGFADLGQEVVFVRIVERHIFVVHDNLAQQRSTFP